MVLCMPLSLQMPSLMYRLEGLLMGRQLVSRLRERLNNRWEYDYAQHKVL